MAIDMLRSVLAAYGTGALLALLSAASVCQAQEKAAQPAAGKVSLLRVPDGGTASESQRSIMKMPRGLDGSGTVAADGAGHVYVTCHAPEPDMQGEENRCVWVARSTDEGKPFALEERANADPTGACGCCDI